MSKANPNPDPERGTRWRVAIVVAILHVIVIAGLIRAFTPDLADTAIRAVTQAFTLPATPPTPPPSAQPSPSAPPSQEGASGAPARAAKPKDAAAPRSRIATRPTHAPPLAGSGADNEAGAALAGDGTGASGPGQGAGAGGAGSGQGGGGASPTVKIAGDINSARDYPRATRDLRIGASVTIDLTVGTDGRVAGCRVVQPSPDAQADRITCELATERFRFRPATDRAGNPARATYRWRQRWFY